MSAESATWIAVHGAAPERLLTHAGLRRSGRRIAPYEAGLFLLVLRTGWSVLVDRTHEVLKEPFGMEQLADVPLAILGFHTEDPRHSEASGFERGVQIWHAPFGSAEESEDLATSGRLPAIITKIVTHAARAEDTAEAEYDMPLEILAHLTGWRPDLPLPEGAVSEEVVSAGRGARRVTPADFEKLLDSSLAGALKPMGFRRVRRLDFVRPRMGDLTDVVSVFTDTGRLGGREVHLRALLFSETLLKWRGPSTFPTKRGEPDHGGLVLRGHLVGPDEEGGVRIGDVVRDRAPKYWTVSLQVPPGPWIRGFVAATVQHVVPWLDQMRSLDDAIAWKEAAPSAIGDLSPAELLAAQGRQGEALARVDRARASVLARGEGQAVGPFLAPLSTEGVVNHVQEIDRLRSKILERGFRSS